MKKTCLTLASLLLVLLISAGESMKLATPWQYQAAVAPDAAPRTDAWKTTQSQCGDGDNLWLRRTFQAPENYTGKRWRLEFDLINHPAIIFLNGRQAGELADSCGELDITGLLRPGNNELLVFNTRNYTGTIRRPQTDFLRTAGQSENTRRRLGIPGDVRLTASALPAAITDSWAETSWRKKQLDLHLKIDSTRALRDVTLRASIHDPTGKFVFSMQKNIALAPGVQTVTLSGIWANPILWELDGGQLCTARIELEGGAAKDARTLTFGFREIWAEGRTLMMNGHPSRWRTDWEYFGLTENSLSFFRLYGRNMIYYQSNPSAWWGSWPNEMMNVSHAELELCDRAGIAVLFPVPSCNRLSAALSTPEGLAAYRKIVERYIRRYRRHPSILGWCTAMNSLNPVNGIHPETMGQRSNYPMPQGRTLETSYALVKSLDPTRLVYAHAEGNAGDLASGNVYPNFAPVQEVADWPELWHEKGDMPWWAAEYCAIYPGSYFKGRQFLMTEYGAIFFGDKAYDMETPQQLAQTVELGVKADRHGSIINRHQDILPMRWAMEQLYAEATDRAWRTWGVTGWHYFNFAAGYGNPPGAAPHWQYRYKAMKQPLTERPAWANIQFDIYRKNMQPLLCYIGGAPAHTDRTHSYYAGEKITKQLVCVWDGPGAIKPDLSWQAESGKTVIASGQWSPTLQVGDIVRCPIRFDVPQFTENRDGRLRLFQDGREIDSIDLQFYPRRPAATSNRTLRLYDPTGKSAALHTRLNNIQPFSKGEKPADNDILIIGREALRAGEALPFSPEDVKRGLKVWILEQRPEVWEQMGFRTMALGTRAIYPDRGTPAIMTGIHPAGLQYWRGSSDLLPAYRRVTGTEVTMAPKGSNRNVVAPVVLEIPIVPGVIPLLAAEFDLAYSPLLAIRYGKGKIVCCTLELANRLNQEPAADRLTENIIRHLESPDEAHPVAVQRAPAPGENVVRVGLHADELKNFGIHAAKREIQRVNECKQGTFAARLPRNLLRWRGPLSLTAITDGKGEISGDGLFLLRRRADGTQELFVQPSPEQMEKQYPPGSIGREAVELSILRLTQLTARAATELGAGIPAEAIKTICGASNTTRYQTPESWFLFGPFYPGKIPVADALEQVYPGEAQALSGDMNPNLTYRTKDGRVLDFRRTASPTASGLLDIAHSYGDLQNNALCYAITQIHASEPRKALLRLGFDYYGRVYLNGKPVFQAATAHSNPTPNQFRLRIQLQKGVNTLVVKSLSGSKGFGFWADLSSPGTAAESELPSGKTQSLYHPNIKIRSPYEYIYW